MRLNADEPFTSAPSPDDREPEVDAASMTSKGRLKDGERDGRGMGADRKNRNIEPMPKAGSNEPCFWGERALHGGVL